MLNIFLIRNVALASRNVARPVACSRFKSTLTTQEELQKEKLPNLNFDRENKITLVSEINDIKDIIPKYKGLKAMENAPEKVKRIYSWEFASHKDKVDNMFLNYYENLKHYEPESHEVLIIKLTLRLRLLKIRIKDTTKKRKIREENIVIVANLRNRLVWDLRLSNFDRYEKIMKALDLKFTYPPVFDQYAYTSRAQSIADMRIRTFAHIKGKKEALEAKKKELRIKEEEFERKIRNNEIDLDHEITEKPSAII